MNREHSDLNVSKSSGHLPLFLLEDRVVLPGVVVPVAVTAGCLTELSHLGLCRDSLLVFACPPAPGDPAAEQSLCSSAGVLGRVLRFIRMGDSSGRLLVQGERRVCLDQVQSRGRLTVCRASEVQLPEPDETHTYTVRRRLLNLFNEFVHTRHSLSEELGAAAELFHCPGQLADFIAANMPLPLPDKRALLPLFDPVQRAELLIGLVGAQIEENAIEIQPEETGPPGLDRFLRERPEIGRNELDFESDMKSAELDNLAAQVKEAGMSAEAQAAAESELSRLRRLPASAAEYHLARTWLDWLLGLPWKVEARAEPDLDHVRRVLEREHFGLEEVKERIVEHLAVRLQSGQERGAVLCLAGPPGVGKTSLGQSIAQALGRQFCRVPLGGVRDEADIRGHRRTYVGALPGRLIQHLRRIGVNDPVMLLDEIDKLGGESRSDPASALLEVLDPAQNGAFTDNYLGVGFDLSRLFFITTANLACQVPAALRDRLEVIELPGYTPGEKLQIARRHILPRQLRETGLEPESLRVDNDALSRIIERYTREAGVRQLEREISALCRKAVLRKLTGGGFPTVTNGNIAEFLGPPRFQEQSASRSDEVGVATALAWTSEGGELLLVEALRMEGARGFELTGQLGDVMKESARAAQSWLRANSGKLAVTGDFFATCDIHLHVPAGATPKDGPSAGLAIAAALASLMTGRAVRSDTAMTGEITLRGRILPVGGVREKVIAAHRAGLRRVLLPAGNQADLVRLPAEVAAGLSLIPVDSVEQAIEAALVTTGDTSGGPK